MKPGLFCFYASITVYLNPRFYVGNTSVTDNTTYRSVQSDSVCALTMNCEKKCAYLTYLHIQIYFLQQFATLDAWGCANGGRFDFTRGL